MSTHQRTVAAVVAAAVSGLAVTAAVVPSASAAPKPKAYANCTALNKDYKHGVALSTKSKDKTTGKPVTTFVVNKKVYELNDGAPHKDLDRDNDGVACEKK